MSESNWSQKLVVALVRAGEHTVRAGRPILSATVGVSMVVLNQLQWSTIPECQSEPRKPTPSLGDSKDGPSTSWGPHGGTTWNPNHGEHGVHDREDVRDGPWRMLLLDTGRRARFHPFHAGPSAKIAAEHTLRAELARAALTTR